ncbi:unnamed protein product [Choristocarpus tenellus]
MGFPRFPLVEDLHQAAANEMDIARAKAETKLKDLLTHRRKLMGVLKKAQEEGREPAPIQTALGPEERAMKFEAGALGGRRRSSFSELKVRQA